MSGDLADEDLVRIVQADPTSERARVAAGTLFGRYHRQTYLWCYRMVKDHDTAMDVAQDAMLDALRGLPSFEARSRFSSWMFTVARRRCLTALRRRSLVRDEDADPDALGSRGPGPEAELLEKEGERAFERLLLEHLEPLEQDAIWMRCVEELPVDEITRLLRLEGASGARGVLQSARRKLRQALERRARRESGEAS